MRKKFRQKYGLFLIHAEQMSLDNFTFKEKAMDTDKTKQLKQDILNQQESIGFPKLIYFTPFFSVSVVDFKQVNVS